MQRSAARRLVRLVLLGLGLGGAAGCARPRVAQVYPQVLEYRGREIGQITWENTAPFSTDSLATLTETQATNCSLGFLPFCFPGTDWGLHVHHLDLSTLGSDLARLSLLYRQSGYFGTRVVPVIDEPGGHDAPITLHFVVHRANGVVLDSVIVDGTQGIADPDSLARVVPLQPGHLFDIGDFVRSADTIAAILRTRGHPYAEVLQNYSVDTVQDRATAQLVAVPGPRVVVDSILVFGNDVLDRNTILRQLTFHQGDLLRRSALTTSQRNLYNLDMVGLAGVAVAPDSLQRTPEDSTQATVSVQVTEAAEHVVSTLVGWGTQDCGRVEGTWTDRSFAGGARLLQVSTSVSRICTTGRAQQVNVGSDQRLPYGQTLDYHAAVELRQPYFLAPANNVVATVFAERQSEARIFRRVSQGARLVFSRDLARRELLSTSLDVERRRTEAAPAFYCAAFAVCTPSDLAELGSVRWRNALSGNWVRDHGNRVVDPTGGYTLRSSLMWASPLLASDYDFLRANLEGALYHELRPGWVAAFFLRGGSFLTQASIGSNRFVPPEERFYTGGANSVRGYARNNLGPGVWLYTGSQDSLSAADAAGDTLSVDFLPTGGTSVAVGSAELRFPAPFMPERFDLATFVDAGAVGLDPLWRGLSGLRVTPGVGLRVRTPVGPVRLDVAYNPYPSPKAPLYEQRFATGVVKRVTDVYQPPPPSFWSRLQLHIALGQAF